MPSDHSRPHPVHVVVVDDDPAVRDALRSCFEFEGYEVTEASNSSELYSALAQRHVDLVTLDLGLQNEDGLAIARDLRTSSRIPLIMITGKGDLVDRIVGLELGADDYIAKPFHVREVLARVRSVLRRAEAPQAAGAKCDNTITAYAFGGWKLDCIGRRISLQDGPGTHLTDAEYRLLEIFLLNPNRNLSREELTAKLKGGEWNANPRFIDNQVGRLKRRLAELGGDAEVIKSIRAQGYMLTAQVRPLSDGHD